MAIFELKAEQIIKLPGTSFGAQGIKERADLQRLLRTHCDVVSPETLVIAEEFGYWEVSKRRIDLLGLDKQANLVVIELKRTEDGGHMELQAIRYAAMVSTMTFDQAVAARARFQSQHNIEGDPEQAILSFLDWDEPDEESFAQAVRIVLVSADFSKELTTAVMWLNMHDLDIRCVRLKPYALDGRVLMDVQQVIPLPEAAEYQVQVKEKSQKERKSREGGADFTRYDVSIQGKVHATMWKRRAILLVVRTLVDDGVAPDQIAELIYWRSHNLWWTVEAHVDSEQFASHADKDAQAAGKGFNALRWFCGDDDELIHANGLTYALSSQWGKRWPEAMTLLAEKFPDYKISFTPTKAND